MLTVRDLLDLGIEIQGNILVKEWIEEKNDFIKLIETDSSTYEEKALDKEITFMYAEGNNLVFEVKAGEYTNLMKEGISV